MISYFLPAFFVLFAIFVLGLTVVTWFMRRGALRDADEVYDKRCEDSPASLRGLDRDGFRAAFMRAHGPRGQIFMAAGLAGVLVLTPAVMALLDAIWRFFWLRAETPAFYAPGVLMWQFYMFFGMIGLWAVIVALAARFYHRKPRGSIDEEIIREAADRKTRDA
ncbi:MULTISPECIES: hypothetical protein [Euryhalocaulis]|uniref:hypothetical protein n=1 Tax=Euryhalocaulis TaxID=1712422 RepID=UPI0003A125DB|nr:MULTISPECIES: hypothetical protein [Euryhalocaulis]MBA4801502.1 hypothetical protein [Euryhalocaulis sp.]